MAKGKYQQWLEPDGLLLLAAWARDGLTDEQIAHNCGVDVRTLARWKNEHCQICHALKEGKEVVDTMVENALFKRAIGYFYEEKTYERKPAGEDGEMAMVLTKTVTKEVIPDTTAQIFWLKNRKRYQWRDKQLDDGADTEVLEKAKEMLGGVPSAF